MAVPRGMAIKLTNAGKHLADLDRMHNESNRFLTDWDIPIVKTEGDIVDEARGGGFLFEMPGHGGMDVRQFVRHKPLPELMPAVLGDFLFNYRSALDHAVWALHAEADRSPRVEFPVFLTAAKYAAGSAPKIGTLPQQTRVVLESLQPFHAVDPELHPLWILHELNRVDKHRVLHVIDHQLEPHSFTNKGTKLLMPTYCIAIDDTGLRIDKKPVLTVAHDIDKHMRAHVVPALATLFPG